MIKDNNDVLANKVAVSGMLANIFLMVIKFAGGLVYNSAALIADGINSLTDIITDIFAIVSLRFSNKPEDESHNYGHQKFEVIVEATISIFIAVAGYHMFVTGFDKLKGIYKGEIIYNISYVILVVELITVIIKEIMYRYMFKYAEILDSDILKAKALDCKTDYISSGTMLVGLTVAMILGDKWTIIDPILAIMMAGYIMKVAFGLLKNSVSNLIDPSLGKEQIEKIKEIVEGVIGVADPHNVRTLKLGKKVSINLHLRVDPSMSVQDAHAISVEVEKKLREEYGDHTYIYVHIEPIKGR